MSKSSEIRRENLRQWAAMHGIPPKEKSYFSQIFAGGAFGEKAARRIEADYKMTAGWLDIPSDVKKVIVVRSRNYVESVDDAVRNEPHQNFNDAIRLLDLFNKSNIKGRQAIMKMAESAASNALLDSAADNQSQIR